MSAEAGIARWRYYYETIARADSETVNPLNARCAIIYNTQISGSQEVAEYYADRRGIPSANLIGFAMGTSGMWAYSATRYNDFWLPLYNHVKSIDKCSAVFLAAGCPLAQQLEVHGESPFNTHGTDLASHVSGVVRLVEDSEGGDQPHTWDSGAAYDPPHNQWKACMPNFAGVRPLCRDLVFRMKVGATAAYETFQQQQFVDAKALYPGEPDTTLNYTRPKPDIHIEGDYSPYEALLHGRIAYAAPDYWYTKPSDFVEQTKRVIDNAIVGERQNHIDKPVVIGVAGTQKNWYASHDSLMIRVLKDVGFTDVKYFYKATQTGHSIANELADSALADWTQGDIESGVPVEHQVFLAAGGGFLNHGWNPDFIDDDSPAFLYTWRPNLPGKHRWKPHTLGVFLGGQSASHHWQSRWLIDGGCSGRGSFSHETDAYANKQFNCLYLLLKGYTLAEAVWLENGINPGLFAAGGDPLYAPFKRTALTLEP